MTFPVLLKLACQYCAEHVNGVKEFDCLKMHPKRTSISRKASQRLFLMQKLKSFDVSQSVLEMVFKSVGSVWSGG